MKLALISAMSLGAVALAGSSASAAVIGATVADASSGNYTLTSVSVTRTGAGTFTYLPSQLIGVDVTHVDLFQTPLAVPRGASLPAPGTRATLLEDNRLDTGLINVTRTTATADRSLEITFLQPVINSAGEDILIFELGGDEGFRWWINDDRAGQGADATAAGYSNNLLTGVPYSQYSYDNAGDRDINDLAELESTTGWISGSDASGNIRAIGLDLSAVGVPLGGSVTSIRLQTLQAHTTRADPVLIVGLPVVPEPASLALVGLAAAAMTGRRRRA